jgi:hypothetical protein
VNPLLLVGLGVLGLLALTSSASASSSSSASSWPPSVAVQQSLMNQIAASVTGATGQAMSASDLQQLQLLIAQAPANYAASLPAGTQPTTAGYVAWAQGTLYQGIMGSSQVAQYGATITSGILAPGYR